jgi:RNA polymerase sigma-70 factor (ECF subfamily)
MGQVPFETVVAMHHGEIFRYLQRVTLRRSEADDLSQETFVRAFRAYGALAPDSNVRAWLFAIATNLSRNHFRAERRRLRAHAAIGETRSETDGTGPEGETFFREARTIVEAVVDRLPVKQRLAFILRKVHDLDYDAVGQGLGCSAETARAHVFQALRKIRHGLNGHNLPERAEATPRAEA